MRKQRDVNRIVIQKILDHCNDIEDYKNQVAASYEVYLSNKMFRAAVDMSVLQIGELTKHLSDEFKAQYPDILWHKIKGLRNVYVHEYEKVNLEQAWTTVAKSVPELKAQLEQIIEAEGKTNGNNDA